MNKTKQLPSKEYLHECFEYLPETGHIKWKIRPISHFMNEWRANNMNSRQCGKIINAKDKAGYLNTNIHGKMYRVHRIVWKMFHGYDSDLQIDHINGDRLDNRIDNLREATNAQNNRNKAARGSSVGYKGVSLSGRIKKPYRSQIGVNGKFIHLGNFLTPEEAHKAYCEASVEYHKEYGRVA